MNHLMSTCAVVFTALLAVSGVARAEEPVNAKSGQPVLAAALGSHVRGGCGYGPAPEVTITAQPAHGTVSLRAIKHVFDSGFCKGNTANLTIVVYRSKPGFRGTDSVSYQYSHDKSVLGVGTRSISDTVQLIVE